MVTATDCRAQQDAANQASLNLVQASANLEAAQEAYDQAFTDFQAAQQALQDCLAGHGRRKGKKRG